MVAADLGRMLPAGVLPLADHHLAAVHVIAFGLSAGAVFFNPASASVLPPIVDEHELVAANSVLWSAAVVSQIALAPAGGALDAGRLYQQAGHSHLSQARGPHTRGRR